MVAPRQRQQSISSFFVPTTNHTTSTAPFQRGLQHSHASPDITHDEELAYVSTICGKERSNTNLSEATPRQRSHDSIVAENGEPSRKRQKTTPGTFDKDLHPYVHNEQERSTDYAANTAKKPLLQKTSKFLYRTSTRDFTDDPGDDSTVVEHKLNLHERFLRKLGRPESIGDITRRNHLIDNTTADGTRELDITDGEAEDRGLPEIPLAKRKAAAASKGAGRLTPLERQYLEIRQRHPDTLLAVEVGYKFRFLGEDARTAAKELGIVCIPGKYRYDEHPSESHIDRFASASIPVHRLHVHVKRLVAAGHKVGIVKQIETAALKAVGENRNAPFIRELTNLYTKSTYIDEADFLEAPDSSLAEASSVTGYLLCLTETNPKDWCGEEKVHIGIVAVQPSTGAIIIDDMDAESELETRIFNIAPSELLIVGELSKAIQRLVDRYTSKASAFGDNVRVTYAKTGTPESHVHVRDFYAAKSNQNSVDDSQGIDISMLSEQVVLCLSRLIMHLVEYDLHHVFHLRKNFHTFSSKGHMLLDASTMKSLEIFENQTDYGSRGSLMWVLDHTKTRPGQRLLRTWLGSPLLDIGKLRQRLDAVEELKEGEGTIAVDRIKKLLAKGNFDLEKSLIKIYYKRCTRSECFAFLQAMQSIATEYATQSPSDAGFQSDMINEAIASLPMILDDVTNFVNRINPAAAKENDKENFFNGDHETNTIMTCKAAITGITHDLDKHRTEVAKELGKMKVDYTTVGGVDYLIEVDNADVKNVPASWTKSSGTKRVARFHTPLVLRLIRRRDQQREALALACDTAFKALLNEISALYASLRECIMALAILDCLMSFTEVAGSDYTKPEFLDEPRLSVKGSRHPIVEKLLLDNRRSFVPNDIDLSADHTPALLLTGPNQAGKSCYARQVALIVILSQIGSYVPAASAKIGMVDAIFTRMGASDNMVRGESSFMVELSETRNILQQASPRSLVVLDELGRGTSTLDGLAIASAVLEYVLEKRSLLLFITHQKALSKVAGVKNVHMSFAPCAEDDQDVTLLHELVEGVAQRSYGLNVARLARMPKSVMEVAANKSQELELELKTKRLSSLTSTLYKLFHGLNVGYDNLICGIEQL